MSGDLRVVSTTALPPLIRCLAFYLPQFHPCAENDRWWGPGFTDWLNVVRAGPLFPGHYQPHLPADLGFYDLRVAETREAQAELARAHGISGFCYYHYWFNGIRLLHRPLDEVLRSGRPDFPFCLCWANEDWTRRWDGRAGDILVGQRYSLEDDIAHIDHLLPILAEPRYIRIGGRPLLLVYRTELLPDPARTADCWRQRAQATGLGELYLARVESFRAGIDPRNIGFDAAVEFAPDWRALPDRLYGPDGAGPSALLRRSLVRTGLVAPAYRLHRVYSYRALAARMERKPAVAYRRFRCVTPGWDNSARRRKDAVIFAGSTPDAYAAWLDALLREARSRTDGGEALVFVNAWNEWAEGNHLEPDQRWGRAYLEATARAVAGAPLTPPTASRGAAP